jgi:hypothetical protein
MASTISAGTSAGTAIAITGDTSGVLSLLTNNGTTAVTIDTSANLKFNSGYGSVATAYGCRSWVNFNGTGTVAIRASGNVSSITDNGTGNYTVNFTTAMPDANFCADCAGSDLSAGTVVIPKTYSASSINVLTLANDGTGAGDAIYVNVAVFR